MKIPKLTPVQSTNLKAIGHDGSSLFIEFAKATYRYPGVPKKVYDDGLKAKSPGTWFRSAVMGTYTAERLDKDAAA